MVEQHSKDYKLTAVKYYLTHKTMRGFSITLRICLVILGMLTTASFLPIIRLYKAYSCYQNGKRNILSFS